MTCQPKGKTPSPRIFGTNRPNLRGIAATGSLSGDARGAEHAGAGKIFRRNGFFGGATVAFLPPAISSILSGHERFPAISSMVEPMAGSGAMGLAALDRQRRARGSGRLGHLAGDFVDGWPGGGCRQGDGELCPIHSGVAGRSSCVGVGRRRPNAQPISQRTRSLATGGAHGWRGRILWAALRLDAAAAEAEPDSIPIRKDLAIAYWATGDAAGAQRQIARLPEGERGSVTLRTWAQRTAALSGSVEEEIYAISRRPISEWPEAEAKAGLPRKSAATPADAMLYLDTLMIQGRVKEALVWLDSLPAPLAGVATLRARRASLLGAFHQFDAMKSDLLAGAWGHARNPTPSNLPLEPGSAAQRDQAAISAAVCGAWH